MKIKVGDQVKVIAGQDKGKEGKVLTTLPSAIHFSNSVGISMRSSGLTASKTDGIRT